MIAGVRIQFYIVGIKFKFQHFNQRKANSYNFETPLSEYCFLMTKEDINTVFYSFITMCFMYYKFDNQVVQKRQWKHIRSGLSIGFLCNNRESFSDIFLRYR